MMGESISNVEVAPGGGVVRDSHEADSTVVEPVGVSTVFRFLVGDRRAIESIAATPSAIWLGLALVMTGALARNYDTEDLVHEPWHVLGSFVMSAVVSALLYGVTQLLAWSRIREVAFFPGWRAFLTLVWMTAPMAWLYAIPYERFLSPVDAAKANIATLFVVAIWRVLLLARAGWVLLGTPAWFQFSVTTTVSAAAMGIGLMFRSLELVGMMGGIQLTEEERVVHHATLAAMGVCQLTFLFGAAVALTTTLRPWSDEHSASRLNGGKCSRFAWLLPVVVTAMFTCVMPSTQAEQRSRTKFELLFWETDYRAALALLEEPERTFPPGWVPPPRVSVYDYDSPLLELVEIAADVSPEGRAARLYLEKQRVAMVGRRDFLQEHGDHIWPNQFEMEPELLEQWLTILNRFPVDVRGSVVEQFEIVLSDPSWADQAMTDERRERIEQLRGDLIRDH